MPHTDRAPAETNQGKGVRIETLEDRMLLSASFGGGDGDRFQLPAVDTQFAVADFNGDGKADIASLTTVNLGRKLTQTSLIVQLGRGDGTFAPASARVVGSGSNLLAGDFNHDGKADLAVLAPGDSGKTSLTLYTGDGTGKFTAGAKQDVGVLPLANVAAGDVNGDGAADLIAWNNANVFVSLNNGAGTLLPAVQYDNPFGTAANPAALGDLDGDNRPELLGVHGGQIFPNKAVASTGQFMLTFPLQLTSQIPLANKKLVVADVNGDGKNDLIALGDGSVNVALQVAQPGTTVLTFGPWTQTRADVSPTKALVGDVNGDGKADVFRPSSNLGFVGRSRLTLISNGDGTFRKLSGDDRNRGRDDHDDDDDDND